MAIDPTMGTLAGAPLVPGGYLNAYGGAGYYGGPVAQQQAAFGAVNPSAYRGVQRGPVPLGWRPPGQGGIRPPVQQPPVLPRVVNGMLVTPGPQGGGYYTQAAPPPANPDIQTWQKVQEIEQAIDQLSGMQDLHPEQKQQLIAQKAQELNRLDPQGQYRRGGSLGQMNRGQLYVAQQTAYDARHGVLWHEESPGHWKAVPRKDIISDAEQPISDHQLLQHRLALQKQMTVQTKGEDGQVKIQLPSEDELDEAMDRHLQWLEGYKQKQHKRRLQAQGVLPPDQPEGGEKSTGLRGQDVTDWLEREAARGSGLPTETFPGEQHTNRDIAAQLEQQGELARQRGPGRLTEGGWQPFTGKVSELFEPGSRARAEAERDEKEGNPYVEHAKKAERLIQSPQGGAMPAAAGEPLIVEGR